MRIQLRPNFFVLVDECDAHLFEKYNYRVGTGGYVVRTYRGLHYLHRDIAQPADGMVVDHINGVNHDCRRGNLRVVTRQQNMWNSRRRSSSRSMYKGVVLISEKKRSPNTKDFSARVMRNGKQVHLGVFSTEVEAALAYDAAARAEYGEYARLNFPEAGGVSAALAASDLRAA